MGVGVHPKLSLQTGPMTHREKGDQNLAHVHTPLTDPHSIEGGGHCLFEGRFPLPTVCLSVFFDLLTGWFYIR